MMSEVIAFPAPLEHEWEEMSCQLDALRAAVEAIRAGNRELSERVSRLEKRVAMLPNA